MMRASQGERKTVSYMAHYDMQRKRNCMKRVISALSVLMCSIFLIQSDFQIPADVQQSSAFASFSFPIESQAYTQSGRLFVGSRDIITDQDAQPFALSGLAPGGQQFIPLAPQTVTLNGHENVTNPLHGAGIARIQAIQDMPLVVTKALPNSVLLVGKSGAALLQTDPLHDGNGANAQEIIGLYTVGDSYAAAVVPNSGVFGDAGAGIAFGKLTYDEDNQYQLERKPDEFVRVSRNSLVLTRNGRPLARIQNDADQPVVFTSSVNSPILYSGFSVTAGSQADSGARSIMISDNIPIIPESALRQDAIVGTNVPNTEVWTHALDTTMTSTRLSYLVVAGGVGDKDVTQRTVYALPLVNDASQPAFGRIAARGVEPQPQFSSDGNFIGLQISQGATTPGTMWSPHDVAVRVGGERDLPGAIKHMWVEKDTVFVAVPHIDTGATLPAGVYASQALFNAHGRIVGWTDWTLAAGAANTPVARVIFEGHRGNFLFASQDERGDITRISRTQLELASGVYHALSKSLSDRGGVQGVVDIPYTHPALQDTIGERLSLTIATGFETVVLAQTARDVDGVITPNEGVQLEKAGDAVAPGPTDGFILQGGALAELGAIITADVGGDVDNNWLIVGGSGGVAILQAPDGSGWPGDGLQAFFSNLPSMTFVRIPGITHVRHVTVSDANVYVLTQTHLYRIPLNRENVNREFPVVYTIADANTLCRDGATFADVVVSGSRAVLATSCGLFQSAGGSDIREQMHDNIQIWEHIALPESVGPVTRLYTISPTGLARDVATQERGGAIYALSSAVSIFQSQVYRLAVTPESGVGTPDVSAVSLYPDYFRKRTQSYFISRNNYRNFLLYDGAIFLLTRSRYAPLRSSLLVEMLPAHVRSGMSFIAMQSGKFLELAPHQRIEQPLRSSATGALMLYGDFGMYVQQ